MATVTKGRTFVSGETVTPTKLNELVDNATVSGIVNADVSASADIAGSKLADASSTTTGITNSKLRHSAALSVIGRSANTDGAPADIAAATDGHVMRRSGTTVGFGTVATAGIADASITAPKLDGAQTGSAPIYGCRAWVNFNGTRNVTDTGASTNGANVLIRASGNVSSVLKNAVGDFTINFSTAMPDTNYCFSGTCNSVAGPHPFTGVGLRQTGDLQTTSVRILTGVAGGSGAAGYQADLVHTNFMLFR